MIHPEPFKARDGWACLLTQTAGWTVIGWKVIFLIPWACFCCCAVLCLSVSLSYLHGGLCESSLTLVTHLLLVPCGML